MRTGLLETKALLDDPKCETLQVTSAAFSEGRCNCWHSQGGPSDFGAEPKEDSTVSPTLFPPSDSRLSALPRPWRAAGPAPAPPGKRAARAPRAAVFLLCAPSGTRLGAARRPLFQPTAWRSLGCGSQAEQGAERSARKLGPIL